VEEKTAVYGMLDDVLVCGAVDENADDKDVGTYDY
jgi:hypothetical protein